MAAWRNLTSADKKDLLKKLRAALTERGIEVSALDLENSGLSGRYRLYVVSPAFQKLDYSERLSVLSSALEEAWEREDQLRLTLQFPLAPDDIPTRDRGAVGRGEGSQRTQGGGRRPRRTAGSR